MRLANEIAAAAMDHVRGVIRPGHDRGADRRRVARVRPRRGDGLGRQRRACARLLARVVGRGHQDLHGDHQPPRRRGGADPVRDLGLRRRLLVRSHEERRRRRADRRSTPSWSVGCARCTTTPSPSACPARASPSSTAESARGSERIGYAGQPSHPICHGVGARAHEPPYAHQAGGGEVAAGMVLAIEPGCYMEGGGGLRLEDNFADHRGRPGEAQPVPRRDRAGVKTLGLDRHREVAP